MTRDERRAMWHERIEAFKVSGESSVTAWCATNNICVQSMYTWLKKDWQKTDTAPTAQKWVSFATIASKASMPSQLNIAGELSHLCEVLSQRLRRNEPVSAEQRATINRKTSCIIKLHANQHDTNIQEVFS